MTTNHPTIRDQLQTLPFPQQLGLLEDAVRVVVDGKPRDWDEDLLEWRVPSIARLLTCVQLQQVLEEAKTALMVHARKEGASYRKIADAVGLSEAAVRKRITAIGGGGVSPDDHDLP